MANENERPQEDHLDDIHAWIANIPCSKPKKNLTRDFSNAVLMAEVLKVYYPRHVDLHNYAPANNVNAKICNWNLLNRKVLAKIDMKLSSDKIQQLANAHPGAIEQLLSEVKNKISKNAEQGEISATDEKNPTLIEEGTHESESNEFKTESNPLMVNEEPIAQIEAENNAPVLVGVKAGICSFLKFLFGWLFIFNILHLFKPLQTLERPLENVAASTDPPAETSSKEDEGNSVPYQVFAQMKEELRGKNDIIMSLNEKIGSLENAIKRIDLRIIDLTTQVLEETNSEQVLKARLNESTPSKSKSKLNT